MATPIGRIHVYYDIPVFGDDPYMAHRLEPAPYRTLVYPVLLCQLRYGLLPVNVLSLYGFIVNTFDCYELATACLAFVALGTMLKTISYR